MALVIVAESPTLTTEQRNRLGLVMVAALKGEGVDHTVVYFQPGGAKSLYVDGVLVEDAEPTTQPSTITMMDTTDTTKDDKAFKDKARRNRQELEGLKSQLVNLIKTRGSISSLEATADLKLRDCAWAPATLRRLFGEMEEEKLIFKSGQKRGTRYSLLPEEAPVLVTKTK